MSSGGVGSSFFLLIITKTTIIMTITIITKTILGIVIESINVNDDFVDFSGVKLNTFETGRFPKDSLYPRE